LNSVHKRLVAAFVVGALVAAGAAFAPHLHAHGDGGGSHPDCIEHRAVARYQGTGYTHVVVVQSRCERTASCEVATDVDPSPRHDLSVGAGETREVITRVGSPAYGFTEIVDCELD
jgi:hypothetical protein